MLHGKALYGMVGNIGEHDKRRYGEENYEKKSEFYSEEHVLCICSRTGSSHYYFITVYIMQTYALMKDEVTSSMMQLSGNIGERLDDELQRNSLLSENIVFHGM